MRNKWIVLMAFFGVALANQMLWLNFAPLITFTEAHYGIDQFTALLLLMVFPVMYVLFSIHAGSLIDKKSYKNVMSGGAMLMALGAVIRVLHNDNFWILLFGQCLIAISQPYIINGISKLVADWFPDQLTSTATGIGTVGMFIGMALGAALSLPMADAFGYTEMLGICAGFTLLVAMFFILVVKDNRKASGTVSTGSLKDYARLLKHKNILVLNIISFLALGFFNGITNTMEPILAPHGISADQAGEITGGLIIGGIIGAGFIPFISDKIRRRKPFIMLAALSASALSYNLLTGDDAGLLMGLAIIIGLLFLPGYPLLIASSEEEAGKENAGAATGMLMFSGNLGGVVAIFGMQLLSNDGANWMPSIYLIMGFVFIATIMSFVLKETAKRQATVNNLQG